MRVSTPFLFVSLGECLTERAGRINLGNEGVLVFGAMAAYAISYHTGSPWLGVLAAALAGSLLGAAHGLVCSLPKVNDIAMGIAFMLAGTGLAFFLGKPYVQPTAPQLPTIPLGFWSDLPQVRSALEVSPLFFLGIALAFLLAWAFRTTRAGLTLRIVGDSADAARAMGLPIVPIRIAATAAGSALAGIGGAFLSLSYPGSWNEGLSSGPGPDGRGPRRLRPLEPPGLRRRRPPLRCGRRPRPLPPDGRRHPGLLPLLRRPLRPHPPHHDPHRLPRPRARGMPGELSIVR